VTTDLDNGTHGNKCTVCGYVDPSTVAEHTYGTGTCSCGKDQPAPTTYTITYTNSKNYKNIGNFTLPDDETVAAGSEYTMPAALTATDGKWYYVFSGWVDGDGNTYDAGQEVELDHDITLSPVWKLYSINGDDKWNIDDVLTLLSHVSKPEVYKLTDEQEALADWDVDGVVTMADVKAMMQNISSGKLVNKPSV
jgi:hypothetical protein